VPLTHIASSLLHPSVNKLNYQILLVLTTAYKTESCHFVKGSLPVMTLLYYCCLYLQSFAISNLQNAGFRSTVDTLHHSLKKGTCLRGNIMSSHKILKKRRKLDIWF
jgi:hypothetical protein